MASFMSSLPDLTPPPNGKSIAVPAPPARARDIGRASRSFYPAAALAAAA
jgi:hypothetical protein